jgi:ABC-type dipeptide/oligopeptide/nickel transport system ATPase component
VAAMTSRKQPPMPADHQTPLAVAAARRHELTRAKAIQALRELDRAGRPVSFASVAAAAGISRSWLYTQRDIRDQIQRLRCTTAEIPATAAIPASQRATDLSLRGRLAAALERNRQLADAGELLTQMGIEQYRDTYPVRLSGGERQRVAIARALVNSPELLLADEPTGALDSATGQQIGRLLRQLSDAGQTLVLITHDAALAERQAARTVRLMDGRVVGAEAELPI